MKSTLWNVKRPRGLSVETCAGGKSIGRTFYDE
jgi:hypothetical protein